MGRLRDVVPGPPEGSEEINSPAGMSNLSFEVEDGVEDALRRGDTYTHYAGWNFNGRVWFADDTFRCQVWQWQVPVATFSADTLDKLMHAVSSEYGYE